MSTVQLINPRHTELYFANFIKQMQQLKWGFHSVASVLICKWAVKGLFKRQFHQLSNPVNVIIRNEPRLLSSIH
jgi:hypothetical protein